ncbi:MAG: glycosyltransferase [Candidatus Acidiferrales bacterium]|jgi:glycosyltransferase involved in cell wall biosynthesis
MSELNIVIPVYNEGANFPGLWNELSSLVKAKFIAYVVYDFDQDNTVPIVNQIIAEGEPRLRLVKNGRGRGVVSAIMTGFDVVPSGPVLVVMADLSDDLAQVDGMLALYSDGYDVVAGSRYMKGGRLIGGPFFKQLLSRLAGISLWWLRRIPTHDASNAFKIYDSGMVKSFTVESRGGFELNLELTVKAFLAGYCIAEVPSTWRDRTNGQSRFRLWKWLPLYLHWYLYAFRRKSGSQVRARRPAVV